MKTLYIKKALHFAAEKHNKQYRKGSCMPYIVHPVQVAFGVTRYTSDEEVIASAFLHDVLEDCPDVSVDILQKEFNTRIAQIVEEVSFIRDKKCITWKEKKEKYLKKIKNVSKEALMIIAVDKMDNLQSYFDALQEKGNFISRYFGGTSDEYCWFYTEIGKILTATLGEHLIVKDYNAVWQLYKNKNL